jgi:hypothetical protein
VDHLALQVGEGDRVVVDNADRADPGPGEIFEHGRAQPARADHQHAGILELLLPRAADFRQQDVPPVAFDFGGAERVAGHACGPMLCMLHS